MQFLKREVMIDNISAAVYTKNNISAVYSLTGAGLSSKIS